MRPFDTATLRLDLLHATHLSNVAQMPRGNVYLVIQSFNSYMAYARQLSGLETPLTPEKLSAGSTSDSDGSLPVCPVATVSKSADRSGTQLHGVIFKDTKRLRRKEDLHRFQEFLQHQRCCQDFKSVYWKMLLNDPLALEDFTELSHDQANILRLCILVQHKVELDSSTPELMLHQCRKLQTQNHPRRREENNKFLFKRFFKWIQKSPTLSPRQAFERFRAEVLEGQLTAQDVEEHFRVVRDTPPPFGGGKQTMEKAFHVPVKINAEFENKLLRIPRFREVLSGFMRDHLTEQARTELKDGGIRCLFRFYLILKEIDLNAFSSVLSNHVFTKKCKAPWTVSEVNEIIADMTARIRGIELHGCADELDSTLGLSPAPDTPLPPPQAPTGSASPTQTRLFN